MKKEKRNYWFKLKYNFVFEHNSSFNFLMNQKNGSDYVVLYEMLCLLTINTCGVLVKDHGEIVVQYDIEQIQQDCKYFKYDTIVVAIELFKKLGLVAEDPDGFIEITKFDELVGSESESASRVRKHRLKKAALRALQCNKNVTPNVTQEKRYKIEDTTYDSTNIKVSNSSCSNNNIDKNEQKLLQIPLQNPNKTRTDQSTLGGELVYPNGEKMNDQEEYFDGDYITEQDKQLTTFRKRWPNVLMSELQFSSLCDLLSLDELHAYLDKMNGMLEKDYKFNCSHYEQILKMVEQDRKVRKNE